ncbi:hypothetical protein HPP92_009541 [Vanilla planifolia]|uniref:C2H2-type domain-containing protein n=1 Tax=Vanilla planifolia TaxID=51239 RepID=A0A835R802_VANPL|nr:hypothetical protein HPP92_009541 [Vanilla planifolia]
MEFWGIEVKPGQTVKCGPGDERILHLSQASLGESKKEKSNESVPIFVNVNGQKLVLGTLSSEKCAQIQYDLVFEKEFELSHDSGSEDFGIEEKLNGKPFKKEPAKPSTEKAASGKDDNVPGDLKTKLEKPGKEPVIADKKVEKKAGDDSDDDDDSDEGSDDEDMVEAEGDSSEEDDEESSDEETPEKVESGKKRKADTASVTPAPEKKAKLLTPAGIKKTAVDGKKSGHIATPHPAKQGGKPKQSPKSGGSVTCKSCNRNFNSDKALEFHTKAKHGAAAK